LRNAGRRDDADYEPELDLKHKHWRGVRGDIDLRAARILGLTMIVPMKNLTAIIADDEQHLANYLHDRLSALWPELTIVGIAKNGLEALRLIDDEGPTIVFLDIRMPGLTGLEVASRLDAKTHVVFVTAFDQYAVDAFDRQAADYLLKPVTDERLIRGAQRHRRHLGATDNATDCKGRPFTLDTRLSRRGGTADSGR
jgi:DNA-binding LytR/AlgR family response regulator